jgi:TonB-dependent Receptor Plug Domain/Carboxypeptidase regulatory-like domain
LRFVVVLTLLLWALPASADPIEVTGRVVDALGRPVAGASVTIGDLTVKTDRNGRYRAEVQPDSPIVVDKDGYDTALGTATNKTVDDIVLLRPQAGETIEVHGDPPPASPGATTLGRADAERIPGTGGGDLVRTLTAMPGVMNAQLPTGFSGIVIRGSAPQDSKILIDDFEVPLLYHTIAFRAILPTEAIDSLEYIPGGFDVAYGRAGSGIVSLKTRTGTDARSEQAEVSVLDAGVLAQGGIDRNTHYMLAFRRSTIDLILPYLIPSSANLSLTTVPNYYDLQGRIDHLDGDWKLSASTIGSIDAFELYGDKMQSPDKHFSVETEFLRGTLAARWHKDKWNVVIEGSEMDQKTELILGLTQHLVVRRLESTARSEATYTDRESSGFHDLEWRTGVEADVSRYALNLLLPTPNHNGIVGSMRPGDTTDTTQFDGTVWTPDFAAWTALTLGLAANIHLTTGMRVDAFARTNDAVVEPRGQLVIDLPDNVKARLAAGSYRRPAEYQDELIYKLHPESADQVIAGVEVNPTDGVKIQPSLYYTARTDLVTDDANGVLSNQGRGTTYGAELLVTAHRGAWFGWLSYSYSHSTRINYPGAAERLFEYDQPHNLNAALSWHKGAWTLGGRFELYSGLPYTPVTGSVFDNDTNHYTPIYGPPDSQRAPLHHQLDIRIDHLWQLGRLALTGFIDVQNVYLNDSITQYQYSFDYSQNAPIKSLPIIPSIGVRGVL